MKEVKIERYEAYRNSGVEWIGEIPEHWDLIKVKNVFRLVIEPAPKNNDFELLSVYTDIGVKPRRELKEKGNKASTTDGYWMVKKGDIIVNKLLAWMGAIGVSNYDGVTSPAYDILRAKVKIDCNFFHYLFRNEVCVSELKRHSKGIMDMRLRLYFDKFGDILIPFPKFKEQKLIVDYLDRKTTLIDQAIEIKEKQIQLLQERRQILIHQAVTRGLDREVKMKDSGVGKIPEHWKLKRLKNVFNLGKGLTITKEDLKDEGVFCMNYGEIHSKYGFELDTQIHKLKYVDRGYLKISSKSLMNQGDFVFADTSEDIEGSGNFSYLKSSEKIFAGYHTVLIRPKIEINSRFFAYEFDSLAFRNQIRRSVKGVKVYSITQKILKEPIVWIPPMKEQKAIVDYLDEKSLQIKESIVIQRKEIEKLKEYKSTLINSTVTGKIKVV